MIAPLWLPLAARIARPQLARLTLSIRRIL